jgi:hypothetical protein
VSRTPKPQIKVVRQGRAKRVYAEVAGKDVSRVYVLPELISVGPAGRVMMAGIGGVGTEREHRRKGLMRRVYARAMREIARDGYSCSGLFTGTVIVAHRIYREFGYVDVSIQRGVRKLLDPKAAVVRALSRLAKEDAFSGWQGVVAVALPSHPPVHVRIGNGEAKAVGRAPKRVHLSIAASPGALGSLIGGGMSLDYARAASLVEWRGESEACERFTQAFARRRPGVHEG